MVGLYDYAGMNPCPPELFLLPAGSRSIPITSTAIPATSTWPSASSMALGFAAISAPSRRAARELYDSPWTLSISRPSHRVCRDRPLCRAGAGLRVAWNLMSAYERLQRRWRPCGRCGGARSRHARSASLSSSGSATSKACRRSMASSTRWRSPPTIRAILIEASLAGVDSWRWDDGTDGIRFAGARSTSWDTAFALQAAAARPEPPALVRRAHAFLEAPRKPANSRAALRRATDPRRLVLQRWTASLAGQRLCRRGVRAMLEADERNGRRLDACRSDLLDEALSFHPRAPE